MSFVTKSLRKDGSLWLQSAFPLGAIITVPMSSAELHSTTLTSNAEASTEAQALH